MKMDKENYITNQAIILADKIVKGATHRDIALDIANLSQLDIISLNDLTDVIVSVINTAKRVGKEEEKDQSIMKIDFNNFRLIMYHFPENKNIIGRSEYSVTMFYCGETFIRDFETFKEALIHYKKMEKNYFI